MYRTTIMGHVIGLYRIITAPSFVLHWLAKDYYVLLADFNTIAKTHTSSIQLDYDPSSFIPTNTTMRLF